MDLGNYENIRKMFGEGDAKRDEGLVTPPQISRYDNISYGEHGVWNLMDIYTLKNVTACQPTIISIHGGGWVYGTKEQYQFYCMDLAKRGFTVVNFNYRLAPENPFPAAIEDINQLFSWVAQNGSSHFIDTNNIFVVGDSAGAQLASQYIAMLTNKEYQKLYDFKLPSNQITIRAVALNCGKYETNLNSIMNAGPNDPFVAYLGSEKEKKIHLLDTMKYLTEAFPPSFVMTSFYDFLKEAAEPMYIKLKELGIPCEYRLYGDESTLELKHVFHLNIRLEEANICNEEECDFFKQYIAEGK